MEGSEAEGVACCVKHFPGHGDTSVDSHRALPTVDKPLDELRKFELAPFRAAAGTAAAMMTAHIIYPQVDPDHPATMSRRILHGLLREEFGFRGAVITDGMDMLAIASHYGVGNAAVRALEAGADMVMALGTPQTQNDTLDAIAAAIDDGTLDLEAIHASIARMSQLAQRYPCGAPPYMTDSADRETMKEGWRRALTLRGHASRPAPGSKVRLVARQDAASDGVSEAAVPAGRIAESLGRLYDVDLVTYADAESFDWNALPQDGRFTMLASTSRLRYGPNARAGWKPDLHLCLWNPYQALDFDAPALMTYGYAAPALDAVNAWLAGELEAKGKIPVPGF
jgi:beta-N-acetylhexosaminidase